MMVQMLHKLATHFEVHAELRIQGYLTKYKAYDELFLSLVIFILSLGGPLFLLYETIIFMLTALNYWELTVP